ncbi:MAG: hypothetical protein Q7U75_09100 [Desulfobacterales bacterium]|nr:hypothetical protein [Desulfobacterales bacterium]
MNFALLFIDYAACLRIPESWNRRLRFLQHRIRDIEIAVTPAASHIEIGGYRFSRTGFHELLQYVWRGGYPRWENGVRPEYVLHMAEAACKSASALFAGISFSTKAPGPGETERPVNGFGDPVDGGKR